MLVLVSRQSLRIWCGLQSPRPPHHKTKKLYLKNSTVEQQYIILAVVIVKPLLILSYLAKHSCQTRRQGVV